MLVALEQDGFVVQEMHGKHLLIPEARMDALIEVESQAPRLWKAR
jgi:hypothetical protein